MLDVISQIEEIEKQDKELKKKYGISIDEAIKKYLDYVKSPDKLSADDETEYKIQSRKSKRNYKKIVNFPKSLSESVLLRIVKILRWFYTGFNRTD